MTLTEIPSWKRWGLHGVFEWHENQVLSNRLLRHLSNYSGRKEKKTTIHFKGIFSLHFLNGTLAGIAYPFLFYYGFSFLKQLSPDRVLYKSIVPRNKCLFPFNLHDILNSNS